MKVPKLISDIFGTTVIQVKEEEPSSGKFDSTFTDVARYDSYAIINKLDYRFITLGKYKSKIQKVRIYMVRAVCMRVKLCKRCFTKLQLGARFNTHLHAKYSI